MATGLAYSDTFLAHDTGPGHPERADRLRAIVSHLYGAGTWDRLDVWEPASTDEATLQLVHTADHVARIRALIARGGGRIDADTLASPGSWEAALRAAGAAVEAAQRVADGSLHNALCLVRPPGHHATPTQAMGFCLFNNIALAANHARTTHQLSRILIVDWDVHHGNGTQDAFFEDPEVAFLSIHRYGQ